MSPKDMSETFLETDKQNSIFTPRERKLAPLSPKGGSVGLHQQQKFKVNKADTGDQIPPAEGYEELDGGEFT